MLGIMLLELGQGLVSQSLEPTVHLFGHQEIPSIVGSRSSGYMFQQSFLERWNKLVHVHALVDTF